MTALGQILVGISILVLLLGGVNYIMAGTGETVLYLLISLIFATLGTGQILEGKLDEVKKVLNKK